jgi:hypothetical protein
VKRVNLSTQPVRRASAVLTALAIAALVPRHAAADCRLATIQMTPESGMQMAVWLEDADGNFVDTLFVTRLTGTYGLGNRPGRPDFNTNYLWPYGHRDGVLPVWAHRRGMVYPQVVFRNAREDDLSHQANQSSVEPFYCQPMSFKENPPDATTCATEYTGTDKGRLSETLTSLYPPRNDIRVPNPDFDDPSVAMYSMLNDLDAVSRATPPGGQPFQVLAVLPESLPDGDYKVWVEVHHELDYNATYNPDTYPGPTGISFASYGDPYRGQPSLVWNVPITLLTGTPEASYQTIAYVGYSDPNGFSGDVNPPDDTINPVAGTFTYDQDGAGGSRAPHVYPNWGEARLQLTSGGDGMYKVRVVVRPSDDKTAPGAASGLSVATMDMATSTATLQFVAPGDDADEGTPAEYEIRYSVGTQLTESTFETGMRIAEDLAPAAAGKQLTFELPGLLPETTYWVGMRAKDECLTAGATTIISFTTPALTGGEVDACFVATAAWGSLMEQQVGALRAFRDRALRTQVLGEIFVEAYYTFGPALAEVIEPSDDLRGLARQGLSPLVEAAEHAVE